MTFKNGVNADKSMYGSGRKFINVLDVIASAPITHDRIIGSVTVSDKEFAKNEVQYGDILFQRSSETREEVGQSNVYLDKDETATFGGFVIRGRATTEFDPMFFHALLKTDKVRDDMTSRSGGSTRYNIGQDSLASVTVHIPTLPEQQKIAAFLGAVDAKLAALAARQAALVRFKAGLMQKLFSQQLRFTRDDGGAFPDWQEKELRAVSIINPKSPKLPERFRYIDLESVNAGTLGAVSEIDATEAPSRAQRVLQRGDILFQMVRPYQRNDLHFELIGVYVGSTGYAQIRAKQNRHYLFQVLHTDEFVNRVLERCTGTGYPAINSNDLGKVTVPFPHPDEQQKIANALSTMDTKIQAVADQVAKLQTFKKGLLQQMFV